MNQFGPLKLKRCKYGWMLFQGQFIGTSFDLYGEYSESEVAVMRSFVRPGFVVIDVGANIGSLTVPLAQMVGENGRVYAIESHAENFNILCANLALNDLKNTKPINAFVASSADVDTASPVWGEHAFVSKTWGAPFISLDQLELSECALLKVNVDGKELDVLRSGEMLLERFRPILYLENDVQAASADLIAFIQRDIGYDLYWHPAPLFNETNYFANSLNHWAPRNLVSLMVLGVPRESGRRIEGLKPITSPSDWFSFES